MCFSRASAGYLYSIVTFFIPLNKISWIWHEMLWICFKLDRSPTLIFKKNSLSSFWFFLSYNYAFVPYNFKKLGTLMYSFINTANIQEYFHCIVWIKIPCKSMALDSNKSWRITLFRKSENDKDSVRGCWLLLIKATPRD